MRVRNNPVSEKEAVLTEKVGAVFFDFDIIFFETCMDTVDRMTIQQVKLK